jgi:hypothetical protein
MPDNCSTVSYYLTAIYRADCALPYRPNAAIGED